MMVFLSGCTAAQTTCTAAPIASIAAADNDDDAAAADDDDDAKLAHKHAHCCCMSAAVGMVPSVMMVFHGGCIFIPYTACACYCAVSQDTYTYVQIIHPL